MSRSSAVALLVDTRQALRARFGDKASPEAQHVERMLLEVERLLLDVRAGRTFAFDLEFPSPLHVIVSD